MAPDGIAQDDIAVIEAEAARLVAALHANPTALLPWSDRWTVARVAQHVGGTHHVVSKIVADRPHASFSLFKTLGPPELDDPELGTWVAAGTAALTAALRATPASEACWSWYPEGTTVGFWARRMAQETLVHRWDAEQGAGVDVVPMDPTVAADGVDEYLDVFVATTRGMHGAPAGPTIHLHCTDTDGEWLLDLGTAGARTLTREHAKGDVALRGPAEALLLTVWGRRSAADAGVDVVGDASVLDRWTELLPPM